MPYREHLQLAVLNLRREPLYVSERQSRDGLDDLFAA
jgi:hypothetical protein